MGKRGIVRLERLLACGGGVVFLIISIESFGIWKESYLNIVGFLYAICALSLIFIVYFFARCIQKVKWRYGVIIIFMFSLSIHLLLVLFIGQFTNQISDFGMALETSQEKFPLKYIQHYRIFSNWAIYPLYLKFIQVLFGQGVLTCQIFNALICAISSTLIYIICYLWLKESKVGYIASILYSIWPAHLLYSVILTPEFLNIFLTLVFGVLLWYACNHDNIIIRFWFLIGSAICLSLSGFFKSIDKIVMIDLCILITIWLVKVGFKLKYKELSIKVIIFLVLYLVSGKLFFSGLEIAYGTNLNRDPTASFVYIGLNPYTYGTWNENSMIYLDNVEKYNYNYDKAAEETFRQLIKEIKKNKHLSFSYFREKFKVTWMDNSEIWWVFESFEEKNFQIRDEINKFCQIFWFFICILVCIDFYVFLRKPSEIQLFIWLLLFGFSILMFVIEVQPRYKCVFYPYISILASEGLDRLINMSELTVIKKKQKIMRKKKRGVR